MSDATLLRIVIATLGAILLAVIYFYGRPRRPQQGKRTERRAPGRVEPTLGDSDGVADDGLEPEVRDELDRLGREIAGDGDGAAEPVERELPLPQRPAVGARGDARFERVVSLFVAARAGETIGGAELVVAAEKVGLEFGDMRIFHRLVEGQPAKGPVFSMASMVKPGSFDMARVGALRTPGVTFFMTLPGPIPALDSWDMMLPAAQRLAELLDAQVLDEEHNALGRQRIQHIREELRAYDRKQERNVIKRNW
jgi:cell division protein ZipA